MLDGPPAYASGGREAETTEPRIMIPRLMTLWEQIRASLWAVPAAMIFAAVMSAILAARVQIGEGNDPVWFLYSGNAKNAPNFLSNLVTAMITLATLAISITMVVLALAAQQLGPRLIRIFMSDLRTQAMLGLFISTVIYLLLVLRTVYGPSDLVPNLAVTIGTGLVLLSIIVLLLFVHHLARSIIADTIIAKVGADLDANAARLLPERDRQAEQKSDEIGNGPQAAIRVSSAGYIQAIDQKNLVDAACKAGCVIKLDVRAGHHVLPGVVIGQVAPAAALTPELSQKIESSLLTGPERTPVQDLEFSIRQMVEVAVRALSPGVNDPYTALIAIDRLALSLALIMRRSPPQTRWCDGDDNVRLILPASTFTGILDASFDLIRQYGSDSVSVLIRLAERLSELQSLANPEQARDISHHLEMVLNAGCRMIKEKSDLNAFKERFAADRAK